MFKFIIILSVILATVNLFANGLSAKIKEIKGDVKVRLGLNETWQKAAIGMILKDIDTILSGENSQVVLKTSDQTLFILGANSILDIADLRKISEKELFLFLVSDKVDNIEPRNNKTPLRIGNVSLVHGAQYSKEDTSQTDSTELAKWQKRELNGVMALYDQKYFHNSIIKLYNIIHKYSNMSYQGLIYLYLGKGFEAVSYKGKAIEAYKESILYFEHAVQDSTHKSYLRDARMALEKLQESSR